MIVCDLTQFYAPVGGGIKRYLHEKRDYMERARPGDRHVLIVPGEKTECIDTPPGPVYRIKSPLLSKRSRYRVLLKIDALREVIREESPSVIECGDPYQTAWAAIDLGRMLNSPVVGFYHSHFAEAYMRTVHKFAGPLGARVFHNLAENYTRRLYNQFDATMVASPALGDVLKSWGVTNTALTELGVNTEIFRPMDDMDIRAKREELELPADKTVLVYVGRLAVEKNLNTLYKAFRLLCKESPGHYHLLMVGDGDEREALRRLRKDTRTVTWITERMDSAGLAEIYNAADLFVHPGLQETFGLVSLEAQACGTPVIGIRGSYMDRIIFGASEYWADENSPAALAQAITELCQQDLPALGAKAAETVHEKYSWDERFRVIFELYEETIAHRKERGIAFVEKTHG